MQTWLRTAVVPVQCPAVAVRHAACCRAVCEQTPIRLKSSHRTAPKFDTPLHCFRTATDMILVADGVHAWLLSCNCRFCTGTACLLP